MIQSTGASVGYITGFYPAVSQTFIDREVQSLRARGLDVRTISLRRAPTSTLLTEHDREEAEQTWVVLPPRPADLVRANMRLLRASPRTYLRTLRNATRLGYPGARGLVWKVFYFAEAVLVADFVLRERIGHLHAHFANSASWVALLASELADVPWSFTMHGPREFDDVERFALKEKVEASAFVACIGDYARSQLMRMVDADQVGKLLVVRCGVDPERFASALPAAPRGPEPSLVSVGRLVPEKGQAILIEAVAELNSQGRPLRLQLVGDGPDRERLERLATRLGVAERVDFLGSVGQDKIGGIVKSADLFVLASFAEGIPVALMEAMAAGTPVVSTWVMGIRELIEHEHSGLLVTPGRPDLLSAAVGRLLDDVPLRDRCVEAARLTIQATFSHPDVVDPLLQAFERAQR